MGLGFSFFKAPKHRVFNYQPRYYDPQKERLKEMQEAADLQTIEEQYSTRHLQSRMHKRFQDAMYNNRRSPGNKKIRRIVMLLSLAALLAAIFYFADAIALLLNSVL